MDITIILGYDLYGHEQGKKLKYAHRKSNWKGTQNPKQTTDHQNTYKLTS